MSLKPVDALESRVGKQVLVIFSNGTECGGKLKTYDEYMNITLETKDQGEIIIKGSKIRMITS
jgi:small nuclear ribonucleoprotein (snRNP)-like protein|tara:strand:- start:231 stop:419 length:189 start_codon:yes stop_codon:yes gene_type:complete